MLMARHRGTVGGLIVALAAWAACCGARAADQTLPGAGNDAAAALARRSPLVTSALDRLRQEVSTASTGRLREQTEDAVFNPNTCVVHRARLTPADKQAILAKLLAEGLYTPADAKDIEGGATAGVFPPVVDDGSPCPHLPQAFGTAPGSNFGGHHSYPGGLAVHESFNLSSALSFEQNYKLNFGMAGPDGLPHVAPLPPFGPLSVAQESDLPISHDVVMLTPVWHDWAKMMVFQWNADGTEFAEFNFGGNGSTDNYGAAGDSRTGGHHIIGVAEAMARELPPAFIIAQASAHSAPTLGFEYKVVNWLRAAAIIARVDPVARGYLHVDGSGHLRLPPVRSSDGVDFNASGQPNILAEYEIHNLSDADYVFSIPAVTQAQVLLRMLAGGYGYDPQNATAYNTRYRNPAFSFLGPERLLIVYTNGGIGAVRNELDHLRALGVI
jgi:hypothetical protein